MERSSRATVLVVSLIASLFGWGNNIIVPAFPGMVVEFGITAQQVSLVMVFYALPGIFMSPVYGILSDRIGRRRILQPILLLYTGTALGAALAPDFVVLLLFRFLQGLVTAAFFPLAFIILGDLFTGAARSRVVSQSFIVVGIISVLVPFVGGWLTLFSWRFTFLSLFVSLPLMGAIYYLVPETHPSVYQSPSLPPVARSDSSLTQESDASSPFSVSWGAISLMMAVGLCYFLIIFGSINLFRPFYVEVGLGLTSFDTGLMSSLQNLITTMTVVLFQGVVATRSKPWIILIGYVVLVGGTILMILPPTLTWLWVSVLIIGIGKGIANPVLNSYTLDLTSPDIRGRVTALFQSMARIGQSAGPFLFATVFIVLGEQLFIPFLMGIGVCVIAVLLLVPLIQYTNRTGQGKL